VIHTDNIDDQERETMHQYCTAFPISHTDALHTGRNMEIRKRHQIVEVSE